MSLRGLPGAALRAVSRARLPIITIAATYLLTVIVGIGMAHAGNEFALSYRDNLVANAHRSDPASVAYRDDRPIEAAVWDFGRNLLLGAVPDTIAGVSVVAPYPLAASRGWVGGIVSVDADHSSRFSDPFEAAYYASVIVLQLIPYSLAGGAGVNMGLGYFRPRPYYQGPRWMGIPREAIWDAARVYVFVVPLFLVASLWEFLSPWNR